MAETGAPLAGEMSGHIFFADRYYGFDDALYAAIRLLRIAGPARRVAAPTCATICRIWSTRPSCASPAPKSAKFAVIRRGQGPARRPQGADVDDIDGVRVRPPDGWWLLRASNTQAVLVARCEAETEAALGRLKGEIRRRLADVGLEPPTAL